MSRYMFKSANWDGGIIFNLIKHFKEAISAYLNEKRSIYINEILTGTFKRSADMIEATEALKNQLKEDNE